MNGIDAVVSAWRLVGSSRIDAQLNSLSASRSTVSPDLASRVSQYFSMKRAGPATEYAGPAVPSSGTWRTRRDI